MAVELHDTDKSFAATLADVADSIRNDERITVRRLFEAIGEQGLLLFCMILMLPFLLPGIDLGAMVRNAFGGQHLYFPVSERGFAGVRGGDTGEASPYGVIEPILWLLHMHGYCVLEEGG